MRVQLDFDLPADFYQYQSALHGKDYRELIQDLIHWLGNREECGIPFEDHIVVDKIYQIANEKGIVIGRPKT